MKVYKIRDPQTGLFKCAGAYSRWSKQGKVWSGSGPLKNHLNTADGYKRHGHNPNWEICEYDTEPTRVVNIIDFMMEGKKK